MALHPITLPAAIDSQTETPVEYLEIIKAFVDLPDVRKSSGKRHQDDPLSSTLHPGSDGG